MSLDIVVPTVRANASSVRRVAELSVPPAFASLRILVVVDGPQSEEAWLDLRRLEAQHASIELLSTRPGPHGWPAGASAARNVGIEASAADWILFLDDDTAPQPDLLHRYAEAAEASLGGALAGTFRGDLDGDLGGGGARSVYGFAGTTVFTAPPASAWAIAARCSGMCDAFTASCRAAHPPWSPTANLMLRRTAAPAHAGAAAPGAAGGVSVQDVAAGAAAQAEAQGVAEAEAEAERGAGRRADPAADRSRASCRGTGRSTSSSWSACPAQARTLSSSATCAPSTARCSTPRHPPLAPQRRARGCSARARSPPRVAAG